MNDERTANQARLDEEILEEDAVNEYLVRKYGKPSDAALKHEGSALTVAWARHARELLRCLVDHNMTLEEASAELELPVQNLLRDLRELHRLGMINIGPRRINEPLY